MDKYTVVTRESWFSRLGNALKGILVGILLLLGAVALLWWNEGRAILTAKGLTEGAGLVVSVASDQIDPGNNGKLVHVSGRALTETALVDPDFPHMKAKALVLLRRVEMFQWREESQTKETKETGGSVVKETTYSYSRVWSSTLNDSSRFHLRNGHENPTSMPYGPLTLKASDARVGAFRLPPGMLDLPVSETLRAPDNAPAGNYKLAGGRIYMGENPDSPAIGDVRIEHLYAPEQDISLVAGQQGDSFAPFPVSGGKRNIQMLRPGLYDAQSMFNAAQDENAMLTWLLRGLGLVAFFAGFYLILRPLSVLGDVVPLIGSILNAGVALLAFCLSLICGLLVIALAWIYYRPLLGAALLLATAAVLAGMIKLIKKSSRQKKQATNAAA